MSSLLLSLGSGVLAVLATTPAPPPPAPDLVLSTRAVIMPGQTAASAALPPSPCAAGSVFYVHAITAGPELHIGNTAADVVSLGRWAASVWLSQRIGNSIYSIALSAFAEGPQLAASGLPGGQRLAGTQISVALVGAPKASAATNSTSTCQAAADRPSASTGACRTPSRGFPGHADSVARRSRMAQRVRVLRGLASVDPGRGTGGSTGGAQAAARPAASRAPRRASPHLI